jgi:hypothetical protein
LGRCGLEAFCDWVDAPERKIRLKRSAERSKGPILAAALCCALGGPALAECLSDSDGIATDRPTGPNSSATVPQGSVQFENGFSGVHDQGATAYDLPATRVRFGAFACTEFLVDLPDYTHGHGINGVTDPSPAVKHQFQDLPDGLTLWTTIGVALPTGDRTLSGRGPAPFIQLPATYDLGDGLSLNGMYSVTFHPDDAGNHPFNQTSVYLDRVVTDNSDVFLEYVNVYQYGAATQNSIDFGGSYRYAALRQVDFKLGFGVNRAAPDWYFSIGYSFRFDHIF